MASLRCAADSPRSKSGNANSSRPASAYSPMTSTISEVLPLPKRQPEPEVAAADDLAPEAYASEEPVGAVVGAEEQEPSDGE